MSGVSVITAQAVASPATDIFNVTTNQDGTKTTVGFGPLAAGATQVVLSVKGLPDAHATINGDTYAIWWPYDGTSSAVINEMDASGKILKTIDVPVSKISVGGMIAGIATATASSSGITLTSGTIVPVPAGTTAAVTK